MVLLNQLPCPVIITDLNGHILMVNEHVLTVLGPMTEQRQQQIDSVFPPAGRIFLQTHVWPMLLRDQHVQELHMQLLTNDNQRIPVLVNCRKGEFEGVDSYYWVFFVTQERSRYEAELLNARSRAEAAAKALAASERFISTITDAMPSMVAYWNQDLRCEFANRAYFEWFGKTLDTVINCSLHDLLGEQLFNLNSPYIYSVMEGNIQNFECSLPKIDGSIGNAWINYVPNLDPKGDVLGFFMLITDITPLSKARGELKLAYNVFQNIIQGFMVTDAAGTIISVNPAFTTITGYTAQDAIGLTPQLLKIGQHNELDYAAVWKKLLRDGAWHGEMLNCRKNGEMYPAWLSITSVKNEQGIVVNYVTMLTDITERKRVEKLKNEFISTVSHELRTPLTSIIGSLGLLAGGALGELSPNAKQMVGTAQKNSHVLVSLVNDLLDMDKLTAGEMQLDIQEQPLMPLVIQMLEGMRAYGEQFKVSFKLISQAEVQVRVDGKRLIQVLNNLLSNAAKFSFPDSQVDVAIYRTNGNVRIDVIDRGIGIPSAFKHQIFQKFSQVDGSDTRKKGGTGLGLAISKELMKRMNGSVSFESEEGSGSCFYLELPL
jgi:PAS domain S-box-containing protein